MNIRPRLALPVVFSVASLLLLPTLAQAQGGCVDSPENPTLVLLLIGSAAAAIAALKNYRRARPTP